MGVSEELLPAPGLELVRAEEGTYAIGGEFFRFELGESSPGVRNALSRLIEGGVSREGLFEAVEREDGMMGIPYLSVLLDRLAGAQVLSLVASGSEGRLATIKPMPSSEHGVEVDIPEGKRWQLSSHVALRPGDTGWIVESPETGYRALVHNRRLQTLLLDLAEPVEIQGLNDGDRGMDPDSVRWLLAMLWRVGLVSEAKEGRKRPENDGSAASNWAFHDLLFHARSRMGRHHGQYGGTYGRAEALSPLPTVKDRMSEEVTVLKRPDLNDVADREPSLTTVLERRRSIIGDSETPLSIDQLGEFLFRTARVRGRRMAGHLEVTDRPYPGGGGLYELEVYPVVQACDGLESGVYQYRPEAHELCRISPMTQLTEHLLETARRTYASPKPPQVLLVVTARFNRVFWKYESMGYALILKNVGVLMQTMYLVATSMALAPCALGGGNSDQFAKITGLDYYQEGAVGEFVLGGYPGGSIESA